MMKNIYRFQSSGQTFKNVRSVIAGRKGRIWLGGHDGMWRYDGHTSTQITPHFVGHIYKTEEETSVRAGNISETINI